MAFRTNGILRDRIFSAGSLMTSHCCPGHEPLVSLSWPITIVFEILNAEALEAQSLPIGEQTTQAGSGVLASCAHDGWSITVSAGARVLVATKPVDFRRGADSLAALVREQLKHDPFSGTIFIFRSKRAEPLKILSSDGSGLVLLWKPLEQGALSLAADQRRHDAALGRNGLVSALRARCAPSNSDDMRAVTK
jgi:hypothetical protein